jgi:hypothetical protein
VGFVVTGFPFLLNVDANTRSRFVPLRPVSASKRLFGKLASNGRTRGHKLLIPEGRQMSEASDRMLLLLEELALLKEAEGKEVHTNAAARQKRRKEISE